jgi:hypothetical protein
LQPSFPKETTTFSQFHHSYNQSPGGYSLLAFIAYFLTTAAMVPLIFGIISIFSCFSSFALALATAKTNGQVCDCFHTGGETSAYFENHKFWDFRNLPADFLSSAKFTDDWHVQTWSVMEDHGKNRVNKADNIYIGMSLSDILGIIDQFTDILKAKNDGKYGASTGATTRLQFRTQSVSSTVQTTAEMEGLVRNMNAVSVRFKARIWGAAGACAGMFTYSDDTNESDLEILTRSPKTETQYTNQPGYDTEGEVIPGASVVHDSSTSFSWDVYNTYRLDWLPSRKYTSNYINGKQVFTNKVNVPQFESFIDINLWTDNGNFTGKMEVGKNAYMAFEWMEFLYNTTDTPTTGKCKTVCIVDDVKRPGFPQLER